MSRRRRREKSEQAGTPGWMTTFSDLMSLLLTFFILLYSMSSIDVIKFRNISYSLQAVLAGEGQTTIFEGQDSDAKIPDESKTVDSILEESQIKESTLRMYNQVSKFIEDEGLEADVTVSANRKGVFVDIKEAILFESGQADIKQGGKHVLDKLEKLFLSFPNEIVVEGHTDNVPINSSKYPSNWELSSDRALNVVRYLSETKSVPEDRLCATGYGEFRPIAPNDTPENRAQNRRVNLLIIMDDEGEV